MRAFVVTPGFEAALIAELGPQYRARPASVAGVVLAHEPATAASEPAADTIFARQILPDAHAVAGPSVRALAEACFAVVAPTIDGARTPFSLHAFPHAVAEAAIAPVTKQEIAPVTVEPGLGSRVELVGRELLGLLKERRRRAFRHYISPEVAAAAAASPDGLQTTLVQILALGRQDMLVSAARPRRLPTGGTDLAPWPAGVAPIATDRAPPSRAYQKLEEAFQWIGTAPAPGEVCVDLGAAPGGWTLTALRRGARVIAVDRSPVEKPAAGDPRLTMTIGNAFTYAPQQPVDWLLCDVVCEPPRTLSLIERWLANGWCRNLVCTVKFKGRDGYGVLSTLPALFAPHLRAGALRFARVKHLAHNKNEVTVMARQGDKSEPGPML